MYHSKEEEWTYEWILKKANETSMFCWYKVRNEKEFRLRTYALEDEIGSYKEHTIANTLGEQYKIDDFKLIVSSMWEVAKDTFMIAAISNKTREHVNEDGVVQNICVVDFAGRVMREAAFHFWEDSRYLIDIMPIGDYSIFRAIGFEKGKPKEKPVYYVHNRTEQIVAQETWRCTNLNKYSKPGYSKHLYLDVEYENQDVK